MKKTIFLSVLFLSFFMPFSFAHNISYFEINTNIEGSYAYSNYFIQVNNINDCISNLSLSLPEDSKLYFVKDQFGNLNYSLLNTTLIIYFSDCTYNRTTIMFKLRSKQVDQTSHTSYRYIFNFIPHNKITTFQHILKLSVNNNSIYFISPKTRPFIRDSTVIFTWTSHNLSGNKIFLVKYHLNKKHHLFYILIIAAFILSFFVVFKLVFYIISRKAMLSKLELLNEKEKKIVMEVFKKPGITQTIITKRLNLTKSNISKIISKLEFRGVLKRKAEGKINRLYIGEKLRKH